ncbi:MAG TPA: hypothetical protein VFX21_00335 [Acidimicrobiia bacterium]|nr:hypothetical protein [Acidimicrobiia bacterium]
MTMHTTAEAARRSHSIWSAVRNAFEVWYALLGSIAAWTIHILVLASVVQYTCNVDGALWIMHLTTVVTLAMAGAAMVLSWRLARHGRDDETPDEAGRNRFLGVLGLLIGAANVALILLEEVYVLAFHSVRCV